MKWAQTQGEAERAAADLKAKADQSSAWNDELRARFDRQHLDPLREAASSIARSIRDAEQEFKAAERKLSS